MADCTHFRFDLPLPGGGVAASARFGTHELSGLSGFETVNAPSWLPPRFGAQEQETDEANDVSN
jgi:hypothetical protein